jgi:energy-converting hydrogenase Eha subunit B
VLEPRLTAYSVAALAAIWTPIAVSEEGLGGSLIYGVVISGVVLAVSVWLRSVPSLAIGAVGIFVYLTWSSVHFLADTAGLPIALLLAGLVFVAIAVTAVRYRRYGLRCGTPAG